MEPLLLRVFQRQVADQCRFVMAALPAINQGAQGGDHDSLWIGCQMLLVGAANASKLLWGDGRSRAKVAPRREPLRRSLGVDDSSPLKDVEMRNNFEHMDQRLDQWWSRSKTRNHLDRMIGPPAVWPEFDDIDRFRVYDPATASIVFWGQTFPLQPIAAECDRLLAVAEAEASRPHWLPSSEGDPAP